MQGLKISLARSVTAAPSSNFGVLHGGFKTRNEQTWRFSASEGIQERGAKNKLLPKNKVEIAQVKICQSRAPVFCFNTRGVRVFLLKQWFVPWFGLVLLCVIPGFSPMKLDYFMPTTMSYPRKEINTISKTLCFMMGNHFKCDSHLSTTMVIPKLVSIGWFSWVDMKT